MKFDELISICNPLKISGPEPEIVGPLFQDSREVEPHSVFIAVRGTNVDGHHFINDAVEHGALVVITEEDISDEHPEVCMVQVENSRQIIGPLAQAFEDYPERNLPLVGITGTNGKTTVATLVYQVLKKLNRKVSLLGTVIKYIGDKKYPSRLTTSDPIELAHDMHRIVRSGSENLVMEVSSHALEQERTGGLHFKVAAFTNLSRDHLDYHKDFESYARAKKKLFDGLDNDAVAIINGDDPKGSMMVEDTKAKVRTFSFSQKSDADIHCILISNSVDGLQLTVGDVNIKSPLIGRFNAYNLAEVFLICQTLGLDNTKIAEALSTAPGAEGRMEKVSIKSGSKQPLVLVDYAHTPDALENVLKTLNEVKSEDQKLHIVFGCGGDRDRGKRPEMAQIAEHFADRIIVTSDNPRNEDPDAIIDEIFRGFDHSENIMRITDRREAINNAIELADEHTIVLIAGKGHETFQEIRGKRHPFDDREIARKALLKRNNNRKNREVV